MISIAIADSHEIYRKGLFLALNGESDFDIKIETPSFHTLYKKLEKNPCDVLLLTSKVKGYGLINCVSVIRSKFPNLKIIVLAESFEFVKMFDLYRLGINSYLLRLASKIEFISAINKVVENDLHFQRGTPVAIRKAILDEDFCLLAEFSKQEKAIIQCICEDKTSQEIAETLCLSVRTVDWYRRAILDKMNVKSPVGIIKYAISNQFYTFQ